MTKSPFMVAGSGRFTTDFLAAGRGRWIGKEGAEGVYAVGLAPAGGAAGPSASPSRSRTGRRGPAGRRDARHPVPARPAARRRRGGRSRRTRSRAISNARGLDVGRIEAEVPISGAPGAEGEAVDVAYRNLAAFLEALEREGELVRIRERVSPRLEISEIADRAVKTGGPALLFENVEGSAFPVAINTFASRRRMLKALELSSWEEWDARLEFFLDPKPPEGILEKLKAIPRVTELAAVFPKTVRGGACQEVVATGDAVDLGTLPVLTCWPQDAGPFITMPARHHERPGLGQDQRRHVPHAGLRPEHDRHALAEAQGRRGPGPRLRARGPAHGGGRRHRLRSGDGLLGDRARCRPACRSCCSPASCAARPCR